MEHKETIKADGVGKNISFQIIYQVLVLAIPLLTAPYLTRILGETNLGIYSYSYSIGQIFVVLANLGITKYGQRIVAERKNDNMELRKTFWSLLFVHSLFSIFSASVFVFLCFFIFGNYLNIFLIQVFYVLSALFDITWLFYGLEKFKNVVIKNGIIKIVELALIFLFVKSVNDLWIYTLIMSLSIFLGMVVLIPSAIRYVNPIKFSFSNCKEHFKPLFVLFIASAATLLFTFFDKTLLGIFSTKENVAFYEYSNRIVLVPRAISTVVSTVMYSKACVCKQSNDEAGAIKYRRISLLFACFISFSSIFGIFAVGNLFAIEYYGQSFEICGSLMMMLAPTILIVSLGDIIRTQILIPSHKDNEYSIITVVCALINVILSIVLITRIGVYGAIVGSLVSELLAVIGQSIICRKDISFYSVFRISLPFAIIGLVMYFVLAKMSELLNGGLLELSLEIGVGFLVYSVLSIIYLFAFDKDKSMYRKKVTSFFSRGVNK